MVELTIGVVATLKGRKARVGRGVLRSIDHIIQRRQKDLAESGIVLKVFAMHDHSNPADANAAAEACCEKGIIALFGPCDSRSMKEVLKNVSLRPLPKFCTFATATDLALVADNAFFRFTSNDRTRAHHLILSLRDWLPDAQEIAVYSFDGAPDSYSQGLRRDVQHVAAAHGLIVQDREFFPGEPINIPRDPKTPIVICAPSSQAVRLLRQLQRYKHRGNVFGFGSNTNFLVRSALGTVVVADLDRYDPHPVVGRALKEFALHNSAATEPSIATMAATETLINILVERSSHSWINVNVAREQITERLHSRPSVGLCGAIRFHDNGELIGHHAIALLRIGKSRGRIDFLRLKDNKLPRVPRRMGWDKALTWTQFVIAILGLILAVLGFASISARDLFP